MAQDKVAAVSVDVRSCDGPSSRGSAASKRFILCIILIVSLSLSSSSILDWDLPTAVLDRVVSSLTPLPSDPRGRALALLDRFPIVDGHIDLPILARWKFRNQVESIHLDQPTHGEVDIPRLRAGKMGGFFNSVYVDCPSVIGFPDSDLGNFTDPSWRVRDTLEQIDVATLLIQKFSTTFELVRSAKEWRKAMKRGKIANMLGVEGGHQLGSTLASLRIYYELGVRYVTLTHVCNNALADSCGAQGAPVEARWGGLSSFGRTAIKEMNRLGMMIDLSHTAPSTASQALSLSLAPPIFSHSNARGVHPAVRNLPDTILRRIGRLSKRTSIPYEPKDDGEGGKGWGHDSDEAMRLIPSRDTIIMLNFSPTFVSEWDDGTGVRADVEKMADHADYIGRLAGREHVGIGSDFDGIPTVPEGLEDVSKYPNLIEALIRRGWSDSEIAGLANGNILRIIEKVEKISRELQRLGALPETEVFEGRKDL